MLFFIDNTMTNLAFEMLLYCKPLKRKMHFFTEVNKNTVKIKCLLKLICLSICRPREREVHLAYYP